MCRPDGRRKEGVMRNVNLPLAVFGLYLLRPGRHAGAAPAAGAADEEALPPIAAGAWAAWASDSVFGNADHSLTDYPCRMPDGRMGRVAAVLEGEEWTLVCRAA
jgi:hypothetical protein